MTGASPEKLEQAYRRRMHAAQLRREGNSWEDVAAQAGYCDRSGAYNAVKKLLKEHQSLAYDEVALYRQESLDRLNMLLLAVMPKALIGDDKAVTQARLLISQMGDLTGEKAAVKVEIGESDVDRLLREAQDEFTRRAAELDRQAGGVQAPAGADSGSEQV